VSADTPGSLAVRIEEGLQATGELGTEIIERG